MTTDLAPLRFETHDGFTALGLPLRVGHDTDVDVHWETFDEHADEFERLALSDECYGVIYDFDHDAGEFTYLAGVPAAADADASAADRPADAETVPVPGGTFAVFGTTLDGADGTTVDETMDRIHGEWLPTSGYERRDGPEFERYDADFDPGVDGATFEVWIPVVGASE